MATAKAKTAAKTTPKIVVAKVTPDGEVKSNAEIAQERKAAREMEHLLAERDRLKQVAIDEQETADDVVKGNTVQLTYCQVLIKRDAMVKIPVEVYDHEIPILQVIEGEENVEIVRTKLIDVPNFDVATEYDRISRKYGLSENKTAVRQIYGINPQGLADELGLKYVARRGAQVERKAPQSLNEGGVF